MNWRLWKGDGGSCKEGLGSTGKAGRSRVWAAWICLGLWVGQATAWCSDYEVTVTGGLYGSVWGTGPYTDDSNFAVAAVHAGLVSAGQTAIVRVHPVGVLPSFEGSFRHGVTTSAWPGAWNAVSLSLAGTSVTPTPPVTTPVPTPPPSPPTPTPTPTPTVPPVTPPPPPAVPGPVVGVASTAVPLGSVFMVSYQQAPNSSSWVGLFAVDALDTQYLLWRTVPAAGSGVVSFVLYTGYFTPGRWYEARLFNDGGYTRIAQSERFQVSAGNTSPVAFIMATPESGNTPLTVTFNSAGSLDPDGFVTTYAWDFGDGTTGSGQTLSHLYSTVGTYTARLTVTDNLGATASATRVITVNPPLGTRPPPGPPADTTPPSVPMDLQATGMGVTGFTVVWTPATDDVGVTAYRIRRSGGTEETTTLSWHTFGALAPLTRSSVEIQAGDAAGNWSAWSAPLWVSTLPDRTAPTVPANLVVSDATLTTLTVSWSPATDDVGVTGYEVFRDAVSLGTLSTPSRVLTGLAPNTAYGVVVRARDASGNWSALSTPVVARTARDQQPPSVPTRLTVSEVAQTQITVQWDEAVDNVGVTGYEVSVNGTSHGVFTALSAVINGLSGGTSYWLQVRSRDAEGNGSAWSAGLSVTTLPVEASVITSPSTASSSYGTPFELVLTASGQPVRFSATGLPSGLSLDAISGRISGAPVELGVFPVTVSAVNAGGAGAAALCVITVEKALPVGWLADQVVYNQGLLTVTPAMLNARFQHASNPAVIQPSGDVRYTAVRLSDGRVYSPFSAASLTIGLTAYFGPLEVTATFAGDARYRAASVTATFENRDSQPPDVPTGLRRTLSAPNAFGLEWDASADNSDGLSASYEVSIDDGQSVRASSPLTSVGINQLLPGATYRTRVRAIDAFGNRSAWSAPLIVTTPLTGGDDGLTPRWIDVNGDGLRDEIISAGTTAFAHAPIEVSTAVVSTAIWSSPFIYLNAGWEGSYYFYFGWFPDALSSEESYLIRSVRPGFSLLAEPNYAYTICRVTSPTSFQRILNPTVFEDGPVAAIHEWAPAAFWPEFEYFNYPLVLARLSKPVGSITVSSSTGTVMGQLTQLGAIRGGGGALTLPVSTSGLVLSVRDVLGRVLGAGAQAVWEIWDAVTGSQVGAGILGQSLDLGRYGDGQFQIALKIDESAKVWFNVSVPPPLAPVALAVDGNRDGLVRFADEDPSDVTDPLKMFRFWVNADDDGDLVRGEDDYATGIPDAPRNRQQGLRSRRDLEDFARLHVSVGGAQRDAIVSGQTLVGLRWKSVVGTPAINLYASVEADGGTRYLTDETFASLQIGTNYASSGLRPVPNADNAVVSVDARSTYYFPRSFWSVLTAGASRRYLLFEGESAGSGQLVTVLKDANGRETEGAGVWLDIRPITAMYEGPGNLFVPPPDEDPVALLFVHGWNQSPFDSRSYAETAFKRLWHRGFKGRYGCIRWNTDYSDAFDRLPEIGDLLESYFAGYNESERLAWQSGGLVRDAMNRFPPHYRKLVMAHSMGNAVMGSALLSGLSVDTYVLMQSAVPATCYDPSPALKQAVAQVTYALPILRYFGVSSKFTFWDKPTPDDDPIAETRAMSYRGRLAGSYGKLVNFYLPADNATVTGWELNNDLRRPVSGYGYTRGSPPLGGVQTGLWRLAGNPPFIFQQSLTDPLVAMPTACRVWSKASGAEGRTAGAISVRVDLSSRMFSLPGQTDGFATEHSAQFRRRIQVLKPFYNELMYQFNLTSSL